MQGNILITIYSLGQPVISDLKVNFSILSPNSVQFLLESDEYALINQVLFLSSEKSIVKHIDLDLSSEELEIFIERLVADVLESFYKKGFFILFNKTTQQRYFLPNTSISMIQYTINLT